MKLIFTTVLLSASLAAVLSERAMGTPHHGHFDHGDHRHHGGHVHHEGHIHEGDAHEFSPDDEAHHLGHDHDLDGHHHHDDHDHHHDGHDHHDHDGHDHHHDHRARREIQRYGEFPYNCFEDGHCVTGVIDFLDEASEGHSRARRGLARRVQRRQDRHMSRLCQRLRDTQDESMVRRAVAKKMRRMSQEDRQQAMERLENLRAQKLQCCAMEGAALDECFETMRENKYARVCQGQEALYQRRVLNDFETVKTTCCAETNADDVEECFTRNIRESKREWKQEVKETNGGMGPRQLRQQRRNCCIAGRNVTQEETQTFQSCRTASQQYTPDGVQQLEQCRSIYQKCCLKSAGLFRRREWRRRNRNQGDDAEDGEEDTGVTEAVPLVE